MSNLKRLVSTVSLVLVGLLLYVPVANAAPIPITFPVIGSASYSNDFNAPRSGGPHHAIDIIANKGQKIVAAADGTISYVAYPQPSWGYMITINGTDGYTYNYLHLNNDTPGTDNGKGGGINAYASDMVRGNPVKKGQHIGYVGDSGNAEETVSHLHFEIYKGNTAVNPYDSLRQATRISKPVNYPQLANELLPYGFDSIATDLAIGNVDATPADQEIVTGAGARGGPVVRVFKTNRTLVREIVAYNSGFRGGVAVATGDVDGDGVDEIITGAGPTGGPHVKVFKSDGTLLREFYAYDTANRDGINVASGDVDGDGKAEIVVAPAQGINPTVKVFSPTGQLLYSFPVYNTMFAGGVDVAVGDVVGNDRIDEIITAPGKKGGPHVVVYDKTGQKLKEFFAYDLAFRGGTRVSVGNVVSSNPGEEIVTSPMSTGGPHIRAFNASGSALYNKYFLADWWRNGEYNVAAGNNIIRASVGVNHRTTVKNVLN